MLQVIKEKFTQLSSRTVQSMTGAAIGLTTALASIQRTGCTGACRTCQSCSVGGLMLIAAPFILKFQGRTQKTMLGLTLVALLGAGWLVWNTMFKSL